MRIVGLVLPTEGKNTKEEPKKPVPKKPVSK